MTNADGARSSATIVDLIATYKTLVAEIADGVHRPRSTGGPQHLSRTAEVDGGDSAVGNLIADSQLVRRQHVGRRGAADRSRS